MLQAAGISGRGRAELAAVLGSGRRFVTPVDVVRVLGVDADIAAKKLSRWAQDGWVRRVRRGLYIGVPVKAANPSTWSEDPLIVAAQVWNPCYFTGWTAANHWALTEQVFRTTVLKTSERVRSATAMLLDHDYLVGHVEPDLLTWGLKSEWRDGVRLLFADPARCLVELLDRPKLGGGIRHVAEILGTYLDEHHPMLLVAAGDRLGNRAVFKRLGYLIDTLGLDQPVLRSASADRLSSGVSNLDPDAPTGGRRAMKWGLRVNSNVAREGAS